MKASEQKVFVVASGDFLFAYRADDGKIFHKIEQLPDNCGLSLLQHLATDRVSSDWSLDVVTDDTFDADFGRDDLLSDRYDLVAEFCNDAIYVYTDTARGKDPVFFGLQKRPKKTEAAKFAGIDNTNDVLVYDDNNGSIVIHDTYSDKAWSIALDDIAPNHGLETMQQARDYHEISAKNNRLLSKQELITKNLKIAAEWDCNGSIKIHHQDMGPCARKFFVG